MQFIQWLLILLFSFLQPEGNYPLTESQPVRVVTQIHVTQNHDGKSELHSYYDQLSMNRILNYLRLLPTEGKSDLAPESFRADTYEFVLHHSDGSNSTYRQIYREYLQKNDADWVRIEGKADLLFPPL